MRHRIRGLVIRFFWVLPRCRAMEVTQVSVCWFPCLAVSDAGVRGFEGVGGLGDGFLTS
jgi:hypothetical protein